LSSVGSTRCCGRIASLHLMQKGFYLKITEGPHSFLLASDDVISLQNKECLQVSSRRGGLATACLVKKNTRWTAVRLAQMLGFEAGDWAQAAFIETSDPVVGIMAERVHLIENPPTGKIKPFTVVGSQAGGRSVYRGVRVGDGGPLVVLDRDGLKELVETVLDK